MSKGGRLVAFDHEVSEPCETIAYDRPEQHIPGMTNCERDDGDGEAEQRSAEMQETVRGVAVRSQVKGKELIVAGENGSAHK